MTPARAAQKASGRSVVWLAKATGIDRHRLHRKLDGAMKFTPEEARQIAALIHVREDVLMRLHEPERPVEAVA